MPNEEQLKLEKETQTLFKKVETFLKTHNLQDINPKDTVCSESLKQEILRIKEELDFGQ